MKLFASGSQTVGPYLHIGLTWLNTDRLAPPGVKGERIVIQGRLVDGTGAGVSDGVIEIWQANAAGKYAHPDDRQKKPLAKGFRGFGRVPTDAKGRFRFSTVKPGRVPGPDGTLQAPHLNVTVLMRGLLKQLSSRIYFPGDPANLQDPILKRVPAARRSTLVARRKARGVLEWDIVLQGRDETVFFDF
ncbi:MAG: protocatechuate 3,4-dioxygenase subunit alpha [Burkholderiales bacterium]